MAKITTLSLLGLGMLVIAAGILLPLVDNSSGTFIAICPLH